MLSICFSKLRIDNGSHRSSIEAHKIRIASLHFEPESIRTDSGSFFSQPKIRNASKTNAIREAGLDAFDDVTAPSNCLRNFDDRPSRTLKHTSKESIMTNRPPPQYFIIHELSGTQDGPLNTAQIHQLIFKRKIKRNTKIGVAGRADVVPAKQLFSKAFAAADQKQRQQAAAAKKEKQTAKAESKAAKKIARKQKSVDLSDTPWAAGQVSPKAVKPAEKYWGFRFQKTVLTVVVWLVIIGGVIGALIAVIGGVVAARTAGFAGALVFFGQFFTTVIVTFLTVGSILFFRDLIDWMIDVEHNTRN